MQRLRTENACLKNLQALRDQALGSAESQRIEGCWTPVVPKGTPIKRCVPKFMELGAYHFAAPKAECSRSRYKRVREHCIFRADDNVCI